jgi:hypothetical protein
MKTEFHKYFRNLFFTVIASFSFSFCIGQRIYIDTVTYEGTLKFKKVDIRYKRIKSVVGSLNNNFKVCDPEPNPEDETLLLFDKANNCILNFKLNEILADHNDATIMTTDCFVTDSSLKLTRYSYWSGLCNGCEVGIEHFTYCVNNSNSLYLKDSSAVFTDNPKQKLKLSKADSNRFRQKVMKSPFLKDIDRQKIYDFLN